MIQYENKFHEIEKSYLSFSKFLFLNELVALRIFYLFMPICEIFNELLYYQIVLYNIKYKKKNTFSVHSTGINCRPFFIHRVTILFLFRRLSLAEHSIRDIFQSSSWYISYIQIYAVYSGYYTKYEILIFRYAAEI